MWTKSERMGRILLPGEVLGGREWEPGAASGKTSFPSSSKSASSNFSFMRLSLATLALLSLILASLVAFRAFSEAFTASCSVRIENSVFSQNSEIVQMWKYYP